jgi:hypothetical protein
MVVVQNVQEGEDGENAAENGARQGATQSRAIETAEEGSSRQEYTRQEYTRQGYTKLPFHTRQVVASVKKPH